MNVRLVSLPELVANRAASDASTTILRVKDRGIWKSMSWAALNAAVSEIGAALLAANFARGDVAAILSETRPEAAFADLAILGAGAASLALDPDDDADRVCQQLSGSGARLAFVENEEQLDKILSVRARCPALSRIVVFDMKGLRDFTETGCISLADFIRTGGTANWAAAVAAIDLAQAAIVLIPPGDGLARTLSHADIAGMLAAVGSRLHLDATSERLAVMRLSDLTERVWGLYLALQSGCISNYPEGPDTMVENLRELKPTVLAADAAVWDHLVSLATARAKAATRLQRALYRWGLHAGRIGGPASRIADLLVLGAIRREFGLNRLRLAYVGSEPIPTSAMDWARCLGITIQRIDESTLDTDPASARNRTLLDNAYA